MRPSTPLSESPHVRLLQQYKAIGKNVFCSDVFVATEYYRNASECIDYLGRYFSSDVTNTLSVAKSFVSQFEGIPQIHPPGGSNSGHSLPGSLPVVRPILYSDCYQIVDGHHRLAIALVNAEEGVRVRSCGDPVLTPLQEVLLEVLWQHGRCELYQPIRSPEIGSQWTRVRRCSDRLRMMVLFLTEEGLLPPASSTYLDIGSSYGWFVKEMTNLGFRANGVERDPTAIMVGKMAYGIETDAVVRSECSRFLLNGACTYDVTSCFSVLHHFVLGRGPCTATDLMRQIDRLTKRVLFFDTGQSNEAWFKDSLAEWDPDFIEAWLKGNSSFTRIVRLGIDEDRVAPHEENYSRTIFACTR